MTEYQYIESKMNAWDHYGATWAFVWPVIAFVVLIITTVFLPEGDVRLQNSLLRGALLLFLVGFALLIASRTMWIRKRERLRDEFARDYIHGGG